MKGHANKKRRKHILGRKKKTKQKNLWGRYISSFVGMHWARERRNKEDSSKNKEAIRKEGEGVFPGAGWFCAS